MPVVAPRDGPATCARSTPIACMKTAMSSANCSFEYTPSGLSDCPAPRRSTEMQVGALGAVGNLKREHA
jgi:hypothetical protein